MEAVKGILFLIAFSLGVYALVTTMHSTPDFDALFYLAVCLTSLWLIKATEEKSIKSFFQALWNFCYGLVGLAIIIFATALVLIIGFKAIDVILNNKLIFSIGLISVAILISILTKDSDKKAADAASDGLKIGLTILGLFFVIVFGVKSCSKLNSGYDDDDRSGYRY